MKKVALTLLLGGVLGWTQSRPDTSLISFVMDWQEQWRKARLLAGQVPHAAMSSTTMTPCYYCTDSTGESCTPVWIGQDCTDPSDYCIVGTCEAEGVCNVSPPKRNQCLADAGMDAGMSSCQWCTDDTNCTPVGEGGDCNTPEDVCVVGICSGGACDFSSPGNNCPDAGTDAGMACEFCSSPTNCTHVGEGQDCNTPDDICQVGTCNAGACDLSSPRNNCPPDGGSDAGIACEICSDLTNCTPVSEGEDCNTRLNTCVVGSCTSGICDFTNARNTCAPDAGADAGQGGTDGGAGKDGGADAGRQDAGTDAGNTGNDAGTDGGRADGGMDPGDGGTNEDPILNPYGCGCGAGGGASTLVALGLLAALAAARRRERRERP